jgi:hypothetical protein
MCVPDQHGEYPIVAFRICKVVLGKFSVNGCNRMHIGTSERFSEELPTKGTKSTKGERHEAVRSFRAPSNPKQAGHHFDGVLQTVRFAPELSASGGNGGIGSEASRAGGGKLGLRNATSERWELGRGATAFRVEKSFSLLPRVAARRYAVSDGNRWAGGRIPFGEERRD